MSKVEHKVGGALVACVVACYAALSGCASPTASPPPPTVTATQDLTHMEQARKIAACMTDRGWSVIVDADGAIELEGSNEQEAGRGEADFASCQADLEKSGVLPTLPPSSNTDYWYAEYDRLLALAECVKGYGYPVIAPPTREQFVDDAVDRWHPYASLGELTQEQFAQINVDCPQDLGK